MQQEQSFLNPNPGVVALEIQRMARDGWSLDENRPMALFGFMWEVWFLRNATDEQLAKDEAELGRLSRSEITAIARQAKAEKAAARKAENAPAGE